LFCAIAGGVGVFWSFLFLFLFLFRLGSFSFFSSLKVGCSGWFGDE